MSMLAIEVMEDPAALAEYAAKAFVESAREAVRSHGRFSVALSGGSTPLRLYDLLARDPYVSEVEWTKCHFFWGDERCVPPDHIDSNYGQAYVQLLSKVNVPEGNIHRIHGELPAQQAADLYQSEMKRFFGAEPVFDLILLGVGPDGHTASLFPGSAALDETNRWVVGVPHSTPPAPLVDRVSLTLPVLNAASQVVFMVAGTGKAQVIARILESPPAQPLLPAQRVDPPQGNVTWLIERAAMGNAD